MSATNSSDELKSSAITYAGDVLKYVESTLEKTLTSIRQNRESLLQSNRQDNSKQ